MSSDGQVMRSWGFAGGGHEWFFSFEKVKNPVAGWTTPTMCFWTGGGAPTENVLIDTAVYQGRQGSTNMSLFLTSEGWSSNTLWGRLTGGNDLDSGLRPLAPLGVASETIGTKGRHGQVFDMWLTSQGASGGDTYPNDTSRQFIQVGDFVFKWDGSVVQMT